MVVVLTMIFSLSSIDRGIIPLLVEPIRADLGLSDVQMSLLLGLSFVLLFSLGALPAGYLADIMSRRLLIALSTVLWLVLDILCGVAHTFWHIVMCGSGLGVRVAARAPGGHE